MQLGRYTIDGELGRGGIGVVYRGRDPRGREVAIKFLRQWRPGSGERFAREARLHMQLGEEAGFVPLLDVGQGERGPYLVMPLLSGGTLRDRLYEGPLEIDEAVELGKRLAHALANAHRNGIVHRDVKPENVLFDAHGRALLADLGLAKHFRQDVSGASQSVALSRSGVMRGTAGYMAPEQLRDASRVGPTADVFALGAVIYECVTGQPPFDAPTYVELIARIARAERPGVRSLRKGVPAWLVRTVDRAMAVDPEKRFPDGAALYAALVAGGPTRRLAPLLAGAGLLAFMGLGAAFAVRSAASTSSSSPAPTVSPSKVPAPSPSQEPGPNFPAAWAAFVRTERTNLEWAYRAEGLGIPRAVAAAGPRRALLAGEKTLALVDELGAVELTSPQEGELIQGASFAPETKRALALGEALTLFDLRDGSRRAQVPLPAPVRLGEISPGGTEALIAHGRQLARYPVLLGARARPQVIGAFEREIDALCAGSERSLAAAGTRAQLFDRVGRPIRDLECGSEIAAVGLWSRQARPLLATRDGHLHLFDEAGVSSGPPLSLGLDPVERLVCSTRLAAVAGADRIALVDLEARSVVGRLDLSGSGQRIAALSLEPAALLVASEGGWVWRFGLGDDAPTGQLPRIEARQSWGDLTGRHASFVSGVCQTERFLASAGQLGRIHVWNRATGEARLSLDAGGQIYDLQPLPQDRVLVNGGGKSVRIFDLVRGRESLRLPAETSALAASIRPDGRALAVLGVRGTFELWELPRRHVQLRRDLSKLGRPQAMVLTPDGRPLVGFADGALRLLDREARVVEWERRASPSGQEPVELLASVAGGAKVVSATGEGTVALWSLPEGEQTQRFVAGGPVNSVSLQGDRLLLGLRRGRLEVWNLTSGKRELELASKGGPQTQACWAGPGVVLEGGSWGRVSLLELAGAKEGWGESKGHLGPIDALSFDPKGESLLAIGSTSLRLWEPGSGRQLNFMTIGLALRSVLGGGGVAVTWGIDEVPGPGEPFTPAFKRWRLSKQGMGLGQPGNLSLAKPDRFALSADGAWLAYSDRRRKAILVVDTERGQIRAEVAVPRAGELALSPKGDLLAVQDKEGLQLFDVAARERRHALRADLVRGLQFLPTDPPLLALTKHFGSVLIVDPVAAKAVQRIEVAESSELSAIAATADGRRLVTALADGPVELWDLPAARRLARFDLGDDHDVVSSLAITPDGRSLAVGTGRGRVLVFPLER